MSNLIKPLKVIFLSVALQIFLAIYFMSYSSISAQNINDGFKPLFNGKNLEGWQLKIRSGDRVLAKKVFVVDRKMIHAFKHIPDSTELNTGNYQTHGMIFSEKKYSKYILRFEYKWGKKILNNFKKFQYDAGLYYHIYNDKVWPKGIEYQIRYNHIANKNYTGDILAAGIDITWYTGIIKKHFLAPKAGGKPVQKKGMLSAFPTENYNGLNDKWNKCEIIVMGNNYLIHKLNGKIVNMATHLSRKEGLIGFQAETAEIYYKNIFIKEFLKSIPIEKFIN
ncbi:DUF1080 domain-containing protein [uncultured Polaribacter sp.]|uniref:3-keto-disaccharide hydrolase n=1 Tax=uncultured Polaribacter sp. TaxID=174711 RepID=UPI00260CE448|nr:DUF1080 domain-containing protein [uncultured Polaribacter sp.]